MRQTWVRGHYRRLGPKQKSMTGSGCVGLGGLVGLGILLLMFSNYPVVFSVSYTPAHYFAKGKKDPQFRTKLKIAVELVRRAVQAHFP